MFFLVLFAELVCRGVGEGRIPEIRAVLRSEEEVRLKLPRLSRHLHVKLPEIVRGLVGAVIVPRVVARPAKGSREEIGIEVDSAQAEFANPPEDLENACFTVIPWIGAWHGVVESG